MSAAHVCGVLALVCAAAHGLAADRRGPDGAGSSYEKNYAKLHRKVLPSPKKLAEDFAAKHLATVKAHVAAEAFKHSKVEMVREGNRAAQTLRAHLSRSAAESPEAHCGGVVSAAHLGIKNSALVHKVFRGSFLQDPSMSVPMAGSDQITKDEGADEMGVVMSAAADVGETSKPIVPYVKVFKDGFSFTSCIKDAMYEYGDKFGDNADKYKLKAVGDTYNVSIVKYKEIVLREHQKAMTPTVCYQFCRTVPQMVFFGITAGKDCYCTPFFDESESSSELCDMPCPGDPKAMCGGQNEKSQMFEMHMCADTAGDVLYASVNAEVALVYFYDTAFMTDKIAHHLEDSAKILQEIAGQGGDPAAAAIAQEAKVVVADLFDPKTGWGACKDEFVTLLGIYKKAKTLYEADFSFAKEVEQAEYTINRENMLRERLTTCAKEAEEPIVAVYPFYYAFMSALDEKDLQTKMDGLGMGVVGFHPILYSMGQREPRMSSCSGKTLGPPKTLSLSGCAEACSQANRKPRCTGFQYYQIMDGDRQMPLCQLFEHVKRVQAYSCGALLPDGKKGFLQEDASSAAVSLRGGASRSTGPATTAAKQKAPFDALCAEVRRVRQYSGLSCQAMFGKTSAHVSQCAAECEEPNGPKYSAICMLGIQADRPRSRDVESHARCFGDGNEETDQSQADFRIQEFGRDASGGAGPLIEGEIKMGGAKVDEPYGHVWTPGPAGSR